MTAQLFLNLLTGNIISFGEIALLILDECHHAVKQHPMNEVGSTFLLLEYQL